MAILIVNVDKLNWEQDSVGDCLLGGKYFSGIAFEAHSGTGTIVAVTGYRFGKLHGAARERDPSGLLREEEYNDQGGNHGPIRKWHRNGQLAESAHSEHSINLRSKRWDESGKLIEEKYLLETDARWRRLQEERKRGACPIIDIDLKTLTFFERPEGWGRNEADLTPPQPPPSLELCRALEAQTLASR
jgi:hypothetical protein